MVKGLYLKIAFVTNILLLVSCTGTRVQTEADWMSYENTNGLAACPKSFWEEVTSTCFGIYSWKDVYIYSSFEEGADAYYVGEWLKETDGLKFINGWANYRSYLDEPCVASGWANYRCDAIGFDGEVVMGYVTNGTVSSPPGYKMKAHAPKFAGGVLSQDRDDLPFIWFNGEIQEGKPFNGKGAVRFMYKIDNVERELLYVGDFLNGEMINGQITSWNISLYDNLSYGGKVYYTGAIRNGVKHGYGKGPAVRNSRGLKSETNYEVAGEFEGIWEDDEPKKGKLLYDANDQLSGQSIFEGSFEDGEPYEGTFKFKSFKITGRANEKSDGIFKGTMKDFKPYRGVWSYESGATFAGEKDSDGFPVKGRAVWNEKEYFDGQWNDGKPFNGDGVQVDWRGDTFAGSWVSGKKNGTWNYKKRNIESCNEIYSKESSSIERTRAITLQTNRFNKYSYPVIERQFSDMLKSIKDEHSFCLKIAHSQVLGTN